MIAERFGKQLTDLLEKVPALAPPPPAAALPAENNAAAAVRESQAYSVLHSLLRTTLLRL